MLRFPDLLFQKVGESTIWADSSLVATIGWEAIAAADRMFDRADCELIKDQHKIKVGRIVLDFGGTPTGIYIKRYNAFSARYRIASLFIRSGAVKSLKGAEVLSQAGISTGRPLAAVESRSWGMLEKSFFFSQEIPRGKTVDAYWRESLMPVGGVQGFRYRRNFLKALGSLFRQLHAAGVYHNDLKDANIIVSSNSVGDERLVLLDLEGVRSCWYLTRRRRVKNLVQLNRTLGKFLTKSEKLYFLSRYFKSTMTLKRRKKKWVGRILLATKRADRRSAAKTAAQGTGWFN